MQFYHVSIFQNLTYRACSHLTAMHHAASDNIIFTCHILFPPLSASLAASYNDLSLLQNGEQKRLNAHSALELFLCKCDGENHSKVGYKNNPCPFITYLKSSIFSYFVP